MDYDKHINVLEYIPKSIQLKNIKFNISNKLIEEIINYTVSIPSEICVVSLSGGVDSMVLTVILRYLNRRVICVHINYNNRKESTEEAKFLEEWCKYMNIELILHEINSLQRGEIKRTDYENKSKEIRFKLYKDVLKKYDCSEILLGHHKDDIIENVFNNICRGRNILDLSVIKKTNKILGVKISRPMISIHKDKIYEFAHNYDVPYFKDTTPYWSLRGIYRTQVYPLLNKTYSNNLSKNLFNVANQSDEWNKLIEEKILLPFMNDISYINNTVKINIKNHINSPLCFWSNIFMRIFYKYGNSVPSQKSKKNFINKIKNIENIENIESTKNTYNIQLSNDTRCSIINYILILYFD